MVDVEEQLTYWEGQTRRKHPSHPTVAAFASPKVDYIMQHVTMPAEGRILDVGCGNGYFTFYLNRIAATTGIDYAMAMLRMNPSNLVAQASAFELPFPDNSFDLVFCSNLLHHLPNQDHAIQEMKRVSRRYVVMLEPNRNNPLILALGLYKPEERDLLRFTLKLLKQYAAIARLEVIAGERLGFVTPSRMPHILVKLLSRLNKPNLFAAYSVLITEKQHEKI